MFQGLAKPQPRKLRPLPSHTHSGQATAHHHPTTLWVQDLNYSCTHIHHTHTHTLERAYTDPIDVFHKHNTQKPRGPFRQGHTHSSHVDSASPQTHPCKTLTQTCPSASHPHTELPGPHTNPWICAHNKEGIQMHTQVIGTDNNAGKLHKRTFPISKKSPSTDPCPQPSILAKQGRGLPH